MARRRTKLHRLIFTLGACGLLLPSFAMAALAAPAPVSTQDEEIGALLERVKELLEPLEVKRFVTPLPNSRSVVLAIDGSANLYLFLERGSLRGNSIDTFYDHLEGGDVSAAYQTYVGSSIVSIRCTDYGWNGLGVPMTLESGASLDDVYYKRTNAVFGRADVAEDDAEQYLVLIRDVLIPALEAQGGA